MSFRPHLLPFLLAAVITLLNAAKPAVVDDSAYLLFARHLAHDPAKPYDFDLFWYNYPQPANEILLPPVLPYWLAAGIALFGEHLFLLKLWLFPFAWVLCLSVRSLLRRFAPAVEREGLIAFALSPAVLALFSVMLDVPALALGAAAVALFVRGCDGGSVWRVLLAGLLAALAMQTKYSMLSVPCVMLAYGFSRLGRPGSVRSLLFAGLAFALAFALFAGWEWYLVRTHGESHFRFHVKGQAESKDPLPDRIKEKLALSAPLLSQFGGLAVGLAVATGAGVGWPRWVRIAGAGVTAAGLVAVCLMTRKVENATGENVSVPYLVFALFAGCVFVSAVLGLVLAAYHRRFDADTLFLVGWLVVEVVGTLGMTPFPAARRVIGVCLAAAVLLFHLSGRLMPEGVKLPRWAVGFAAGVGLLVWGVDCWDALPEAVLAEKAAEVAKPAEGNTVWFTGHWGFHYHCDRAGMRHLVTGWDGKPGDNRTPMKAGDWLVLPVLPDGGGFYRPYPPDQKLPRDDMELELAAEFVWLDALSGQTIPNLYGGSLPIRGRDHPRLRVRVYKVLREWVP